MAEVSGVEILTLVNGDAETLLLTLQPLLVDGVAPTLLMGWDKRTNSIIARGDENELKILEAILLGCLIMGSPWLLATWGGEAE